VLVPFIGRGGSSPPSDTNKIDDGPLATKGPSSFPVEPTASRKSV
jgi:hypothetical protein